MKRFIVILLFIGISVIGCGPSVNGPQSGYPSYTFIVSSNTGAQTNSIGLIIGGLDYSTSTPGGSNYNAGWVNLPWQYNFNNWPRSTAYQIGTCVSTAGTNTNPVTIILEKNGIIASQSVTTSGTIGNGNGCTDMQGQLP